MEKDLRILILEDVPTDAELIERELRASGLKFTARFAHDKPTFLKELENFSPDLVLSDYKMPQFDGMEALAVVKKRYPLTPLIIVTGSINEETAVECMKAGAVDYVIKAHLIRMAPAVKSALERKHMREEKMRAEDALRESEDKFRMIAERCFDIILISDLSGKLSYVSSSIERDLGYKPDELIGTNLTEITRESDVQTVIEALNDIAHEKCVEGLELKLIGSSGALSIVELNASPVYKFGRVTGAQAVGRDITDRKRAVDELKEAHRTLKLKNKALEEKHIVLSGVLDHIQQEKAETGERVQSNVDRVLMPLLDKLEKKIGKNEKEYVLLLRSSLQEIAAPFINKVEARFKSLTPRELEIVNLIKAGKTTGEIAETFDTSAETIRSHRKNIRKKLGIQNESVNLITFLQTI
ncbi:MAG: response regulator [Candidatus Zixiibacteriota bacterium]